MPETINDLDTLSPEVKKNMTASRDSEDDFEQVEKDRKTKFTQLRIDPEDPIEAKS